MASRLRSSVVTVDEYHNMKVERLPMRIVTPESSDCISHEQLRLAAVELSLADVAIPPFFYVSMLYAFQAAAAPRVCDLEAALRKVLREYGEFAGEYIGELDDDAAGPAQRRRPCIQLNAQGVAFIQAKAQYSALDNVWPFEPDTSMLSLLPHYGEQLLCIQVTSFSCGGVSLGIVCNHQVADAEGLSQFIEAWAATVRGDAMACAPCHDRSPLMGARAWELIPFNIKPVWHPAGFVMTNSGLIRKRVYFDCDRIEEIKAQASTILERRAAADATGARLASSYSTFVSVLSHVWKCIMVAQGFDEEEEEEEEGDQTSMLSLAVSLRNRLMSPPLPKGYFGNAICHVHPQLKIKDLVSKPLSFTASHVHAAIEEVKTKLAAAPASLAVIQPGLKERPPTTVRAAQSAMSLAQHFFVTSWQRLPLYDVNFGGGTPLFAGNPFVPFNGILIFTPSPKRDGGIALDLALHAPCMERFESLLGI